MSSIYSTVLPLSGSPEKPLRGAVIGYGFISAKGHIPAYTERAKTRGDVEITCVADICEARRTLAQQALPHARIYSHFLELLENESGKLDFIDICTPPSEHAEIAHAALARGLHVLCEKPLTPTLTEARALLDHAQKAQRVLFPCHTYKHAPVVTAIREIIQSGHIGKVRSVTLNTYRNTHAKGVTEWNTHWRRDPRWSGGGIAMDHGSHTFYLTFDWMGEYPTAVSAKMTTLESDRYHTEDQFSAVLTFPSGLAHAYLSWTAGVRKVIYTVQGEKGAITVDDDDLQLSLMKKTTGPDVAQGAVTWHVEKRTLPSDWMDASHVHWFDALFDRFRVAIQQKDFVGQEAREAFLCIQLITTAYQSARASCQELSLEPLPDPKLD